MTGATYTQTDKSEAKQREMPFQMHISLNLWCGAIQTWSKA